MPAIFASAIAESDLATLLRRHDRDRFLLALFAPVARRDAVRAIYAFNAEIARIPDLVSEPTLGRIRLEWWREAIAAIHAGEAPRRHEVLTPLAAAIGAHSLDGQQFERLIEARERDLSLEPPATMAALEAYAEETSAPLQLLVLEVLGAVSSEANQAARAAAIAYALMGLLRATQYRAGARRTILPQTLIAEAGLDLETIHAGKPDPALATIARRIADRARHHLAVARQVRPRIAPNALPALLPAVLAEGDLKRLDHAGFDPFAPGFVRADPWRSWRLTMAALRGRY
ncbi:MAG: phytoene/squalene synthase family protein [Stellaceae bacterium]